MPTSIENESTPIETGLNNIVSVQAGKNRVSRLYHTQPTQSASNVTDINTLPVSGTTVPTDFDPSADNSSSFIVLYKPTNELFIYNPDTNTWHGKVEVTQSIPSGAGQSIVTPPTGYTSADYLEHRVEKISTTTDMVDTAEEADITGANVTIEITSSPNSGTTHNIIVTFKN